MDKCTMYIKRFVVFSQHGKRKMSSLKKSILYEGQITLEELEYRIALASSLNISSDEILQFDIAKLSASMNTILQRFSRIKIVIRNTCLAYSYYGFTSIGNELSLHKNYSLGKKYQNESGRLFYAPRSSTRQYDIDKEHSLFRKDTERRQSFEKNFEEDFRLFVEKLTKLRKSAIKVATGWSGYKDWVRNVQIEQFPEFLLKTGNDMDDDENDMEEDDMGDGNVENDMEDDGNVENDMEEDGNVRLTTDDEMNTIYINARDKPTTKEEVSALLDESIQLHDFFNQMVLKHLPGRSFLNKL